MTQSLIRHTRILSIVGDIMKVSAPADIGKTGPATRLYDLALIQDPNGLSSLAQVIKIDKEQVSLQAFSGTKGFSTRSSVQFLDRPMQVTYSSNILGRVFNGTGKPMDGGAELADDPKVASVVLL